jgi:hypothetical protein
MHVGRDLGPPALSSLSPVLLICTGCPLWFCHQSQTISLNQWLIY